MLIMPGHWLAKEGFGPAGAFGRNPSFCPPGRGAWEAQAGQAGRGAGQQPACSRAAPQSRARRCPGGSHGRRGGRQLRPRQSRAPRPTGCCVSRVGRKQANDPLRTGRTALPALYPGRAEGSRRFF